MNRVPGSRLKVLHVNKFSEVVGGVETHIEMLIDWQKDNGFEIQKFSLADVPGEGFDIRSTGLKQKAKSVQTLFWSKAAKDALSRTLETSRPDVIHFHNVYHHLSPSVLLSGQPYGLANVMTIHDFKLVAPCYSLLRGASFCADCAGKKLPFPAVRYRCIDDSFSKSAVCAVEHFSHRRIYRDNIDAYIAPSEMAANLLKRSDSVSPERVNVISHGVPAKAAIPLQNRNQFQVLYMGRLAYDKGVTRLIEAWKRAGLTERWELVIAGDGAERSSFETMARDHSIRFLGQLDGPELESVLDRSAAVVVPSLVAETFCLAAAEAMAKGIPAIVSDVGNLPDLVANEELVVEGTGFEGWVNKLRWLEANQQQLDRLGRDCRERMASEYSMDRCGRATTAVYEGAIEHRMSIAA